MLDGRSERKTTLVYKIYFIPFISSSTMLQKWCTVLISLALCLWVSARLHSWLRSAVHMLQLSLRAIVANIDKNKPLMCAVFT